MKLKHLRQSSVSIIPVTIHTFAEIEQSRLDLGLNDPAIIEGDGAVIILNDRHDFAIKQLGCTYIEARAVLKITAVLR